MLNRTDKKHLLEDAALPVTAGVDADRFRRQLRFMVEIDRLKTVLRQTYLTDTSRKENSAEHSWHIALAAMVFAEYARDHDLDLARVIQMLLVHDLIEIDAGDTYCYDETANHTKLERERKAAQRLFKMLPSDQAACLYALWQEFEMADSAEARFANALDRLQPFLHNYVTAGKSWQEHDISRSQVLDRMRPVRAGSQVLWHHVCRLLDDAVERGFLRE